MGHFRFSLLLGLFLCMIVINADGFSSLQSVKDSWASQKSAAATAKIHFLKTTMTIQESKFSVDQIAEVVNGLQAVSGPELIDEMIHKLNPELEKRFEAHDQKKQAWSLWDDRTLYSDGFSERSSGENDEHLITQGLHLIYNQMSRNVDCYEAGQSPYFYYDLNWLLSVPSERLLDELKSSNQKQGELQLQLGNGQRMILDAETHVPIYEEFVNAGGEVTKVTFYREPTSFPGGVSIPAVKIQVGFIKGKAKHVMMSAILDAEFNIDIDAEKFQMPLKKGCVLTDLRHEDRHSQRTKIAVADAVEYFSASETQPRQLSTPVAKQKGFSWKAFLLIANGLFLMVLGIFVWRKSK